MGRYEPEDSEDEQGRPDRRPGRRRPRWLALCTALAALGHPAASVFALTRSEFESAYGQKFVPAIEEARHDHVEDQIIVRFDTPFGKDEVEQIFPDARAVFRAHGGRRWLLEFEGAGRGKEIVEAAKDSAFHGLTGPAPSRGRSLANLTSVGLNSRISSLASPPVDPLYPRQWALDRIGSEAAWSCVTAAPDVYIAVLDAGIDFDHEDLDGNLWQNQADPPGNGDDDGNGYADDQRGWDFTTGAGDNDPSEEGGVGHGTLVSGVIAAEASDSGAQVGGAGILWTAKLMPVRILDSEGEGEAIRVGEAIRYAADLAETAGKKVVLNASWGTATDTAELRDAISAYPNRLLVVAAAGNETSDNDRKPVFPASYADPSYVNHLDNVISVTASNRADGLAGSANRGRRSVWIAAPGEDVLSTAACDPADPPPCTNYYGFAGTSAAAPHVTATAALVLARNPGLSPRALRDRLVANAAQVSTLFGLVRDGRRLDAGLAVGCRPKGE